MILVTGATGTIGRHVVQLLTERGVPFRAMSRNPDADLPNPVRADFTDPASLAAAARGADAVFLVTVPPTPSTDHDLALLDVVSPGTKVVKLSAIGSGEVFEGGVVGAWHLAAEQAIADSGLPWTVLRPTTFASNFLWYRDLINAGEPIPNLLGDARQAVVDPRDVAAVAVEALLDDAHVGQRYDLTGPELVSFTDQAAVVERVLGRAVKTVDVDLRDQLAGMPDEAVAAIAIGANWARAGGAAYVAEHVSRVLGRPARTFEQWMTDHQEAFTGMR
jgi:uncharacterized protein YbjT (DUF2867 family)